VLGDVGHPELVRSRSGEAPVDEISGRGDARMWRAHGLPVRPRSSAARISNATVL